MLTKKIMTRMGQMLIVLFGISFLTFLLTYLAPGDPAEAMYEAAGILPTASSYCSRIPASHSCE